MSQHENTYNIEESDLILLVSISTDMKNGIKDSTVEADWLQYIRNFESKMNTSGIMIHNISNKVKENIIK